MQKLRCNQPACAEIAIQQNRSSWGGFALGRNESAPRQDTYRYGIRHDDCWYRQRTNRNTSGAGGQYGLSWRCCSFASWRLYTYMACARRGVNFSYNPARAERNRTLLIFPSETGYQVFFLVYIISHVSSIVKSFCLLTSVKMYI